MGNTESVIVLGQLSGLCSITSAATGTGVSQRHSWCQGGPSRGGTARVAARGRDDVMANPGGRRGADADLDSAGQMDAAALERELIARLTRRRAASGLSQARLARLMQT